MLKKITLAALLSVAALSASAATSASFYVVVPLKGKAAALEAMTVTLNPALLPQAYVGTGYSADLKPALQVVGDSAYTGSGVTWSLASGSSLPAGLSLGVAGAITGTPTLKSSTPTVFTVSATYKGKTGQAAYAILVNGQPLLVTAVASSNRHTCAITTAGAAMCWGNNSGGVLGDGTMTTRAAPTQVSGLVSGVTSISVSDDASCAVHEGAVKCWGYNTYGQLGNGSTTTSLVPVTVTGLTGAQQVTAGNSFACALVAGAVSCWGNNMNGELGRGNYTASLTPVPVTGLTANVTSLGVNNHAPHTCAIQSGAAKCWGDNRNGTLGTGNYNSYTVPQQVSGLTSGVTSIATGPYHTCAVQAGSAKCWGIGTYGALGTGNDSLWQSLTPVQVIGATGGTTAVSVGNQSACLLTSSGEAKCWGYNAGGSLGYTGTPNSSSTPRVIAGVSAGAVLGGGQTPCVGNTDGTMQCWGVNNFGQVGDGTTTSTGTPKTVFR